MLSVIVTIYNIEKYIDECIRSIIRQNLIDAEIILVDDGSTDSSGHICDFYLKKDSRIKVIHKENGGLVSARKTGLAAAKGKYIVYIDGDDWIDDCALDTMVRDIERENADIVFYNHYENSIHSQVEKCHGIAMGVYDKKGLMEKVYPRMITDGKFFEWQVFPSLCDCIIRKEILEKIQYEINEEITMGEDAACIYPCLLLSQRVCFVNRSFYHYRQYSDSMIRTKTNEEIERKRFRALYQDMTERLLRLSSVYDLREQWNFYMLFLMIPRADYLYLDFQNMSWLFPYTNLKKGMKIAIYGAGIYGRRLYNYLSESKFCEVVAWFDRDYEGLVKQGLKVLNPESINEYQFEGIIIANMFENSRKQIRDFIQTKTDCQVFEIEKDVIFSEETMIKFGLY